jgi:hypothetical protein
LRTFGERTPPTLNMYGFDLYCMSLLTTLFDAPPSTHYTE